jgi:class 3 adenylate cyclase
VHTGEVEMRNGEIQGVGVHIASRVMNQSSAAGIVVSGTVKDLVVGSGFQFEACGEVELKGVPGTWSIFELVSLG